MPPAAHRLPRARRIRKRPEFVRIQEGARSARITTRHLLILLAIRPVHDGQEEAPSRLGVVASRKVGPAVDRNRAKRLVREAFRRHPGIFPAGLDVVVVVRPGTHKAAQAEIDEEMRRAEPLLGRRAAELRAAARGEQLRGR